MIVWLATMVATLLLPLVVVTKGVRPVGGAREGRSGPGGRDAR